jgi:hypothetical protein
MKVKSIASGNIKFKFLSDEDKNLPSKRGRPHGFWPTSTWEQFSSPEILLIPHWREFTIIYVVAAIMYTQVDGY